MRWMRASGTRVLAAVTGLQAVAIAGVAVDAGLARELVPLCLVAYTFGLRHALDADHIAAIDNTTRKLVGECKQPAAAGLWFSLGHSSVVFLLTAAAAFSAGRVAVDGRIAQGFGTVGMCVSAGYLYLVAAFNWGPLQSALRALRGRPGHPFSASEAPAVGGVMTRLFSRLLRRVRQSRDLFVIGLLFGLGFETATEVAVLGMSAEATGSGVPVGLVLTLPLCFAAGMSFLDTADGLVMLRAYTWASDAAWPGLYNAVVTGLSVLTAVVVGTAEWLQVLGPHIPGLSGAAEWIGRVDLGWLGAGITAMFAGVCLWMWRARRSAARRGALEWPEA
ncbi:HoxN/HupN/NixA family nickel/cobalt transporter [Alicyclobacillus sp.]|uniref:HoxN/HupN/NixA family nickel/cobalt transporter n=1 Tax=Alicyclobacillus sp. TaxID=61169 RepID=UPI0025BA5777|nr:HoxN/HupN/NixA family nickel/cobalt transporter [Alicyclobacillus sp.]